MHIRDGSIKPRHIVKRIYMRKRYEDVIVRSNKLPEWIITIILTLVISPIWLIALLPNSPIDTFGLIFSFVIFGIPILVAIFGFLARGSSLVFISAEQVCIYRRTYFRLTYYKVEQNYSQGFIGPCTVGIETIDREVNKTPGILGLLLFFLGPIGSIVNGVAILSQQNSKKLLMCPGIVFYNEQTTGKCVMFIMSKYLDRRRILKAYAELAPDHVSVV